MALTRIDSQGLGAGAVTADKIAASAITADKIAAGAVTAEKVAQGVAGGPKISSVVITDNSYTNLDDTAIALEGGYIKLIGSGFSAGCQVSIDGTAASSTTFVSDTEVRAQVGAKSAGSYTVYLVNSDGGVALRLNGLTYSGTPTWVTGGTLDNSPVDVAISVQLSATGATSYSLAAGSTLPTGLTLSSGGLLSGTVTGVTTETTYTFTINAIDAENQDSPRTFSITITTAVPDSSFGLVNARYTFNGTNGATNRTVTDLVTPARSISAYFNASVQHAPGLGTFSPFSPKGWSLFKARDSWHRFKFFNYGEMVPTFGTGDFTVEFFYKFDVSNYPQESNVIMHSASSANSETWAVNFYNVEFANQIRFMLGGSPIMTSSSASYYNTNWHHFAVARSGTTVKMFIDGTQIASVTNSSSMGPADAETYMDGLQAGYVSNLRITNGAALYTTTFTKPSSPLAPYTTGGATSLVLFGQTFGGSSMSEPGSSGYVGQWGVYDENNFLINNSADMAPMPTSPFNGNVQYSAATHGGSLSFFGSSSYLTVAESTDFDFSGNDWSIDCWINPNQPSGVVYGNKIVRKGFNFELEYATGENSTGQIRWKSGDVTQITANFGTPRGFWTHVAVVCVSGTVGLYINGNRAGTTTSLPTVDNSTALSVGGFLGFMSDLRITKGVSNLPIVSTRLTPPAALKTTTTNTNTKLLVNLSGGGVDAIDDSVSTALHATTGTGLDTAVKKYGSASFSIVQNGGVTSNVGSVIALSHPAGEIPTQEWTVEFWFNKTSGFATLFDARNGSNDSFAPSIISNEGTLQVFRNSLVIITGTSISNNTWYHLALVSTKSGGSDILKLYVDGTQVGSQYNYSNGGLGKFTRFTLGNNYSGMGGGWGTIYFDDFRFSRFARYTANFTAPDAELPTVGPSST